jgi:hypothetical protein
MIASPPVKLTEASLIVRLVDGVREHALRFE